MVPALFGNEGNRAIYRVIDFMGTRIRNKNTRKAYLRAITMFSDWTTAKGIELHSITPLLAASYTEHVLMVSLSTASVVQHLAALRMLFDHLVTGRILDFNPFSSVKGPNKSEDDGALGGSHPMTADEVRAFLATIDRSTLIGLRDHALCSALAFSASRVGAIAACQVRHYVNSGRNVTFHLLEKGNRRRKITVHHKAATSIDEYLQAAEHADSPSLPLFRSTRGRSQQLSERPMSPRDIARMIKRRALEGGHDPRIHPHSFRAAALTNFLANGGTLEAAARIAGHRSTRTTQTYDYNSKQVRQADIESIRF